MQDNKSISRDGTDKQNLPYSLGRFWPLWELKAISGWPLLAASVVKGLIVKNFQIKFTCNYDLHYCLLLSMECME